MAVSCGITVNRNELTTKTVAGFLLKIVIQIFFSLL